MASATVSLGSYRMFHFTKTRGPSDLPSQHPESTPCGWARWSNDRDCGCRTLSRSTRIWNKIFTKRPSRGQLEPCSFPNDAETKLSFVQATPKKLQKIPSPSAIVPTNVRPTSVRISHKLNQPSLPPQSDHFHHCCAADKSSVSYLIFFSRKVEGEKISRTSAAADARDQV